jgi:hypothetical protein
MRPDEFHLLPYHHQTETLLKATFLADRVTPQYYVRLYNFDNFYIEAYFDHRSQLIIHYRAFAQTVFVLPYLEELDIAV